MTFVGSDISGLPSLKSCSWSYFKNILAVIPTDSSVHFYNENGNETNIQPISRNTQATVVQWCTNCDILAIGWNDGTVSIWSEGNLTNSTFSLKKSINLIVWHPSLPIFLATTADGTISAIDCTTTPHQLFSAQAEGTFNQAIWVPRDTLYAFVASTSGTVYSFENNPSGSNISDLCDCPAPVYSLMISPATNRLIIICGDNNLIQYSLPPSSTKISQIKLNSGDEPKIAQIRSDVLCYAIGNQITITSLSSDDNLIIRAPNDEVISSLYFDHIDATLYATTNSGKILIYKSTMKGVLVRAGWAPPTTVELYSKVDGAVWSTSITSFVAIVQGRKPMIFRKVLTNALSTKEVTLWQPDPSSVSTGTSQLKMPFVIETISANSSHVLISSSNVSAIYTIRNNELTPFTDTFQTSSSFTTIFNENAYECSDRSLIVRNLQGTVKQTVALGTNASVIKFAANGPFMCVMTDDFSVFLFDSSRRQPKLQFSTQLTTPYELFRVRDMSLSCGGFCISVTIDYFDDNKWKPAPDLFLHSPQFDKTVAVPFEGRVPKEHKWDQEDPRLLCVQVVPYHYEFESKLSGILIFPLFVADSLDVYRQTPLTIDEKQHLCGVDVPNVLITDYNNAPSFSVLPQFEGLDNTDEESKKALMELNFHLATGDIDAAFNSIRGINNKGTWRSLAQTCAQMRRIDLADLCFGRMEDGGSAILLHQAREKGDVDAMYVVDTQLGIYNEAKNVAKDNQRYDLLANIHRSLSEWNEALTITRTQDRIHQKTMAYQYARSLEIAGNCNEAIKMYEESGTIGVELPRLAIQQDDLKILFEYVGNRNSSEVPSSMYLWLGRFFEAHNQVDMALDFYQKANSYSDYVRLLCIDSRWDDAQKYVQKTNKRSVICTYARILAQKVEYLDKKGENTDKLKHEVIELFRKARQFGQALLYALNNQMIDDIFSLSFSAPPTLVCRAAQWFESQKEMKNAILLYNRAGRTNRAMTLCFKHKQYDALDEISDGLNSKTDPSILLICGKYFVESERWSKAATCYALAKQFDKVIDLCNKHNIKLAKNVIQDISEDATNKQYDEDVLKRFAALCEQQQDFITASKLYLKLKDHISSLKVIIRAGDTAKVIKFAKIFRKRDTYILAANYLQTLSPENQRSLFDTIVEFYTKANAPDKLARFYESSSQIEIDEFQDYEAGLQHVKKAIELIEQIDHLKNKEIIMQSMKLKVKLITLFMQAKSLVNKEPKKAIAICVELLRTKEIETCLKSDDIYIIMVQCYKAQGNFKNAFKILDDLKNSGTDLTQFMELSEIQEIYKAVGQVYEPPKDNEYDDIDDEDIEDIEA